MISERPSSDTVVAGGTSFALAAPSHHDDGSRCILLITCQKTRDEQDVAIG
jgi:hypothetical protein